MNPQTLHDAWLVTTVLATVALAGIAIFLRQMFRFSERKWFFWALALVLASIVIEHVTAEIKNLDMPPPDNVWIATQWLLGRAQEAIIAALVLGYMVFGRNGKA
jgi:uncharacterized membrane protein SirB2